jgi:D-arabinose 1-dehydrogenase-like Zn-dependent alcohol dehydrogenase
MKAAIVESAGKLVVRDLPEPVHGDYEARCELLFGSVCAGTDTHLVNNHEPFCFWVKIPFILGHESIGRVVAVGSKVRNLKLGDMVTRVGCPAVGDVTPGWGGFAELGIATDWRAMQEDGMDGWEDKTVQQILPADIDPAVGTLFITWRETLSYVTRMGFRPGAAVLVIGSGGNGLAFLSHARNLGADRVAMVGSAARQNSAVLAGATEYYDYRQEACWKGLEGGFDFVIDSVGASANIQRGQPCLKTGGTIGIYGLDEAGRLALIPGRTFTFYNGGYDEAESHEAVLKFYRAGKLNPVVWQDRSQIFALEDIGRAIEAVGKRTFVKPLVRLRG